MSSELNLIRQVIITSLGAGWNEVTCFCQHNSELSQSTRNGKFPNSLIDTLTLKMEPSAPNLLQISTVNFLPSCKEFPG